MISWAYPTGQEEQRGAGAWQKGIQCRRHLARPYLHNFGYSWRRHRLCCLEE
ncbi:hypothetical protein SK128_001321, partial [Halocaridina rubra]